MYLFIFAIHPVSTSILSLSYSPFLYGVLSNEEQNVYKPNLPLNAFPKTVPPGHDVKFSKTSLITSLYINYI